jgi:2',3'-cyclic-nucleotide 2'-phosphodiesterase / 3'-nucleotidase / 5'-nucleotidase
MYVFIYIKEVDKLYEFKGSGKLLKSKGLRKWTSWVAALALAAGLVTPVTAVRAQAAEAKTFDIVEVTDFHGALVDSSNLPVAAVLAKDIKDVKNANSERTLIFGGGDLYQGSPISNVLKGVPVQKAMSSIGMEVTTLGNHEFDWSLDTIIKDTMKDAKYSIVCANLYDKATNKRVFDPYKIIEKDGIKIGVIGAVTLETPGIVLPANVANYNFTDITTEINGLAGEVKSKGANVVVALIHEGSNQSDKTNATGPIFDIANGLKGVDAVFGGHSHTIVTAKAANGVPVYIANNAGKGYIDAKMTIDPNGKVSFVDDASSYVAIDNTNANGYKAATPAVDADVKTIVDSAQKEVGPTFDEVIGTTSTTLTRIQDVQPSGESYLGNWSADVIRAKVKADVGFQNNGGIRIDIPKGNITVGSVYYLMPFDNEVCTVDMTKAQIKTVLEQAFMDGGKGIQLSGLKVTYDIARKSMDRVTNITRADGTSISDTEKLKVATNDFMMTGGDGFGGFVTAGGAVKGAPANDTHILVRDALIENVRDKKGIVASMDSRITNLGKTINIVGTSDLHGTIYPIDYNTGKTADAKGAPIPGGLARISTYVNGLRAVNPNVMLVDSGDIIQGTPLVTYYNQFDTTSEYPMMKVMGYMKYDTITLGNHEFNFGLPTLNRVISDANKEGITVLSANTYKTADNTNFVKPYFIKSFTVNGKTIKVGILGLTTKTIPSWEDPKHYEGLKFNDLVDEAKIWVPKVKAAGADVVVATIHSGLKGAADTIPENEVDDVATKVSGIDAIICGHTHTAIASKTFTNPDGKTVLVTEPKNTDNIISEVDINVDGSGNVGILSTKNVTIDGTIPVDTKITDDIAKPYEDKTLEYIGTVIGKSTGEFSGADQTTKSNSLMDLINIVQMKAAGTQLSIAAPLSASAYIPSGDVKIQNLMSVYVFENFLYGIKMNGKQLKSWMEYSARYYKQASKTSDPVAKDMVLNVPDYNLDILYGASYNIDLTSPVGNRIKNLKYNGKEIKDTDVFTVAINNYRYNGGGGFMAAAGLKPGDSNIVTYDSAKALGDDGQVRNLMIKYVQDNKTITPTVANNWSVSTTAVASTGAQVVQSSGNTYIVAAGDCLWKIAQAFKTTYQKLAEFNHIVNPDLIFIGQKILIP